MTIRTASINRSLEARKDCKNPVESKTAQQLYASRSGRTIRVLVGDDHAMVRQGIANIIDQDERLRLVGEVVDGIEALEAIELQGPHVAVLDMNMPRMNGIDATRSISRRWPKVIVIGLSVQDDSVTAKSMIEAGASAFLSKSHVAAQMIDTIIRLVRTGYGNPK